MIVIDYAWNILKCGVSLLANIERHVGPQQHEQRQNICITFVQCWTDVEDVEPTLYKCYKNVLCFLGNVGHIETERC